MPPRWRHATWTLAVMGALTACKVAPEGTSTVASPVPKDEDPPSHELGAEPAQAPEPEPLPTPPTTHPEVPIPAEQDRNPTLAAKHFARGVEQILAGRGKEGARAAMSAYQEAILADPSCAKCYWELGWALQLQDEWLGCVIAWDRVRALDPGFPELDEHHPIAVAHRDLAWRLQHTSAPPLPEPELVPATGTPLTLAAVGDVTMGRAWPSEALPPDDAASLFDEVAPQLRAADLAFCNLETVLADEGESTKCEGHSAGSCFAFRVPTRFAAPLRAAGFDLLSVANNHAGDFGAAGRRSTLSTLDAHDLAHSGPIGDVATWERDGLRVAMIAFSTGIGTYRLTEIDVAARVVSELSAEHDIVLVSFHGGAEGSGAQRVPVGTEHFLGEDRGDLRAFTHAVVDAGADLVLGHGPHVLRGLELYRGRLIAYSLGNFSGWRTFGLDGPSGVSGVLNVSLAPNGVALTIALSPLRLQPPGRPEADPDQRAIASVRELSELDFGDALLDAHGRWTRP